MTPTEDHQYALPHDSVYEIQWRRYNEEISVAEPALIMAETAPGKIWAFWNGCKKECDRLNNSLTEKEKLQTVKMIAECR